MGAENPSANWNNVCISGWMLSVLAAGLAQKGRCPGPPESVRERNESPATLARAGRGGGGKTHRYTRTGVCRDQVPPPAGTTPMLPQDDLWITRPRGSWPPARIVGPL